MYQAPPPIQPQRDRKHELSRRGLLIGMIVGVLGPLLYGFLWSVGIIIFGTDSIDDKILLIVGGLILSFVIGALPSGILGGLTGWLMGRRLRDYPGIPKRAYIIGSALLISGTISISIGILYIFYFKFLQGNDWEETLFTYLIFLGAPSILYMILSIVMSLRLQRWSLHPQQQHVIYRPPNMS